MIFFPFLIISLFDLPIILCSHYNYSFAILHYLFNTVKVRSAYLAECLVCSRVAANILINSITAKSWLELYGVVMGARHITEHLILLITQ